jgi:transcriptional regulator with XRE-family HTH domain
MSIIPSSSTTHVGLLNLVSNDTVNEAAGKNVIDSDDLDENATSSELPSAACVPPQEGNANLKDRGELSKSLVATANLSSSKSQPRTKLHRIAEVRISQGISERTLCRRLNIDIKQLRALEDPTSDIPLSVLLAIREALDVPFADLLVESEGLARPVYERAKLLKIMKTAVSIKESSLPTRASRLAQMLNEQLIELMPELADVGGWPEFGTRRGIGSIARVLADEIDTSKLSSD